MDSCTGMRKSNKNFSSKLACHSAKYSNNILDISCSLSLSSGLDRLGFEIREGRRDSKINLEGPQREAGVRSSVFSMQVAEPCHSEASEGRQPTQPPGGWCQLFQCLRLKRVFGVSQFASQTQERFPANQPVPSP